uniref:Ig-like domain-containing protein n=1 Tax=Scleropages formosus TaxID=113540 RepID=A0A8D0CJ14_SCLFO
MELCLRITVILTASEDTVTQSTGDVIRYEGGSVTLSCNFTTSSTNTHYLFWYIQRPNDPPKYVLRRDKYSNDTVQEYKKRFNAKLNTSSVPLAIEVVQLCDSAVYYCALKPTVTVTL